MRAPLECPHCRKPATKQIVVSIPMNGFIVENKGSMTYDCGAIYRWEFPAGGGPTPTGEWTSPCGKKNLSFAEKLKLI